MRKKRGYLGDLPGLLNLDSLVDIVSNNVGILVILAVFMAMFSLIEKSDQATKEDQSFEIIEKIKIPWSHASQKNNLLFLLRDDRILYLDRALVYQNLKKYLSGKEALPKQISLIQYSIKLTTGSGHAHCLEFLPSPGAGQWWHQLSQHDGLLQSLMKKYPPEENYFFFWVDPKSFELFREIRESLWGQHFEVGWKPVRRESTLRYCSGNEQARSFQPQ
ncbi:MAG: hypothetical protein QGI53_02740 [SAR324 cluster bacterium]|jgi:hypothetical protein|nr:hypothetical protein [SAR324 cluster bacterium]MDP7438340.1 hypothetical protein [SAR324 cluster bacterium]MDP7582551.1 hypothetical protein [SAR324 cluster bacterium]|tara:strand:+ start:1062 stop:1718 length:657 start_codon:yes stop_codon:yes gene_type:complete